MEAALRPPIVRRGSMEETVHHYVSMRCQGIQNTGRVDCLKKGGDLSLTDGLGTSAANAAPWG